jgi:hypothetical protein
MNAFQFAPSDSHLADTDAGRAALEAYAIARERGAGHFDAEVMESNVLQRVGYNVNALGGVTIEAAEEKAR